MIAIIDYGISNLKSVANIIDYLGVEAQITRDHGEILAAERIILPGVGSFDVGMKNLAEYGLIDVLNEVVKNRKKPFLGICLGMQLLADIGYEGQETKGLGWIAGEVKKFELSGMKVPHMGWDSIKIKNDKVLLQGIDSESDFYFVHSYYFAPAETADIAATCHYGFEFAAALQKDNIFATQFHPEKSQQNGMKIWENFLKIS